MQPAHQPMPNPWAGMTMPAAPPAAPGPQHVPAPLGLGPAQASSNLGGGLAGMMPGHPGSGSVGVWGSMMANDTGASPGRARATPASSRSPGKFGVPFKYPAKVKTVADAPTTAWLEWLEHVEPVCCNSHYLRQMTRDVVMSYLHVAFGCMPSDALPARERDGPQGVLARFNLEYVRRGRPISSGQLDANQIQQMASVAMAAALANQQQHAAAASASLTAPPGGGGTNSAGPSGSAGIFIAHQTVTTTPYAVTYEVFFNSGSWMARQHPSQAVNVLPALVADGQGYYQVTTQGFSQGPNAPVVEFSSVFPPESHEDPHRDAELCDKCNEVLKRRRLAHRDSGAATHGGSELLGWY